MIELILFLTIFILHSFFNIQTLGVDDFRSGVCRLACLDGGVGIFWDEFGLFGALGFAVVVL